MSKEIANKVASPMNIELDTGETFLSIKEVDGNIFVVDQHGKLINGLISCSAVTNVDELTTLTLTCYSHKRDDK